MMKKLLPTTVPKYLLLSLLFSIPLTACGEPDRGEVPNNSEMFTEVDNYEQFMGRWSRPLAPQLIAFAEVTDGDRVLDVGTGTGALASALIKNASLVEIAGIDPSEKYVAYAAIQNPDPRAAFEVGDAQKMRFADASFDCCLSLLVVNFIPDSSKAVEEMRRVTKPGGMITAAVWDYGEEMQMLRVFWDEVIAQDPTADPRDERHMPLCTKDELVQLWNGAGLIDVEATALTVKQEFTSFDDYWAPFLLGTGPAGAYVAGLDKERRSELRDQIRKRLLKGAEDGPFLLHSRAWAVRGRVPE